MKQQEKETGIIILGGLTYIFAVLIIGICPLLARNKFYDMHSIKVDFIQVSSIVFIILVFAIEIIRKWIWKEELGYRKKITPEMIFAGLVLTAAGVSAILGGNLAESFWGDSGRRFGMLILLLCIVVYFIIGKYFRANTGFIWIYLIANSLVILIGILNFWGIDPLGTYDKAYTIFMGTIGNINVYNSYICIVVPIGMGLYYLCDAGFSKVVYTIFLIMGFYGAYTTNSDSWILGVGMAFVVLFWFALKDAKSMKKFYGLCGIFWISSVLLKGTILAGNAFGITSGFLSVFSKLKLQNIMMNELVLLAEGILLAILLILHRAVEMEKIRICYIKWRKTIFLMIGICVVVFCILVIVVNIKEEWGETSPLGVLLLTDEFGSSRGFIWKITTRIFKDQPLMQQIFGVGMNDFWGKMPVTYQNEIRQYLGVSLLDAHNEFLQYLATTGVVGVTGYFGFLFYHIYSWGKKAAENPILIIGIVTIFSFLAQGLVNNPHVFITTCLFVYLGIMKSLEKCGDAGK